MITVANLALVRNRFEFKFKIKQTIKYFQILKLKCWGVAKECIGKYCRENHNFIKRLSALKYLKQQQNI